MERIETQIPTLEIGQTIVSGLPIGWGSGVLLKDKKEIPIQRGRVVRKNENGKELILLQQFSEKNAVVEQLKMTFGGQTRVKEWKQEDVCVFCACICTGECEESFEI